jgi:hypothetical protein
MENALLIAALEDVRRQVAACYADAPEGFADVRITSDAMTPKELIAHLNECYVAVEKEANGEKHEWGTYDAGGKSLGDLMSEWEARHSEIVAKAEAGVSLDVAKAMLTFVILHNAYHVGQLVLARLQVQPDWNVYSIYGM